MTYILLSFPYTAQRCDSNDYECDSGECIDDDRVCDGTEDCSNGSDEDNCSGGKSATGLLYIILGCWPHIESQYWGS